uniref:CCHC-type domain-containing protein n=1 Tax=Globodera rostochiensis TaxID=31243 RepID=A0A914HJR4_GLORO
MADCRTEMIGREIGIQGEVLPRAPVTGACRKCGFVGHLPFQCRNFIQLKPNQKVDIDISSTSSEEYTTPLTVREGKKAVKKMRKRQKKELKKLEKKRKKEKKKKRKRKHSSSTSDSDERNSDGKKRRTEKERNKKKRRRKSSTSS